MEYKKKLKTRQYVAYGYILLGIALTVAANIWSMDMAFTFGAVFLAMGIARTVQYRRLLNDPEKIRRQEIAEKDERNIMLWTKARSLAFAVYVIAAGIAVIALNLMEMTQAANIVSWCLLGFIAIYWICYFIVVKKN